MNFYSLGTYWMVKSVHFVMESDGWSGGTEKLKGLVIAEVG